MYPRTIAILFLSVFTTVASCSSAHAAEYDAVSSGFRMLWGLLIVLAIMFVLYTLLRKRVSAFQQQGKGIIKVIEIKHIPPKKSLLLIEVRGREFLVGAGSDAITTITPLQQGASFSSVLENTQEKRQHP